MDEIIEFRHNADECRALAAKARSEALRTELLELANQWTLLAAEHERCRKPAPRAAAWVH